MLGMALWRPEAVYKRFSMHYGYKYIFTIIARMQNILPMVQALVLTWQRDVLE